ncbi:hypothetical protein WA026_010668 [Henosepilachna vigintioctopunctata]|uniref:STAS domain-containing protein n=1 Tax=Henosepilachna vigintioctopunctata TaxID=420089 RepID=A0AAW1UXD0_9CUCU
MRKLSTGSGASKKHALRTNLLRRIGITKWLPHYTKLDFTADLVAGLTVGMMMIPQSIAYAGLASLPAQYGLYTAFVGSYVYVFFGSIKQVSIGPTSLLAMLSASYLRGYSADYYIFLSFLAGCVELTMGILNLGFLVDFISPAVSSGFSSAISITIVASQLNNLLGLSVKSHSFFELLTSTAKKITEVRVADTILGLSCIVFLFILKQLTKIKVRNPKIKKTLWFISISRNALIVVISSSIAFYYCKVEGDAPFKLSGDVPPGLPTLSFPKFSTTHNNETVSFIGMIHTLGSGILVIPICAILSNVAIAKSFTAGAIIDASQEMITLGICNIFGSCVQAIPSTGAFSRSAVSNASGVRTPLQGLYSGTVIILALSFLTPYFYFIPKATLAAILMSAVVTMIDYEILPVLWRTNKIDFFLAILTTNAGVIYGSDVGIIVGALFNLVVLLKEWSRPNIEIELRTMDCKSYVLVKPEFGLCYPARDYLTEKIIEAHNTYQNLPLVIDCANILKIDYAAATALQSVLESFNNENSKLILINLNARVLETMENLMKTEKMKYCQSNSNLRDDLFKAEASIETKIPLLDS